jgi:hypothetical protein
MGLFALVTGEHGEKMALAFFLDGTKLTLRSARRRGSPDSAFID